jgi:hypothetical protein
MTAIPAEAWPSAELDGVRRLRVLAAALPGVQLEERALDHPFATVWGVVGDIERNVPRFDREVTDVRILARTGAHLDVMTRTRAGLRVRFDVELHTGFMWMAASHRRYVVGMGAVALDEGRTLLAHLEGVPRKGGGMLARPLARHVAADLDGVERLLREDAG